MNKEADVEMYSMSTRHTSIMADLLVNYDYVFEVTLEEKNALYRFEQIQENASNSIKVSYGEDPLISLYM